MLTSSNEYYTMIYNSSNDIHSNINNANSTDHGVNDNDAIGCIWRHGEVPFK